MTTINLTRRALLSVAGTAVATASLAIPALGAGRALSKEGVSSAVSPDLLALFSAHTHAWKRYGEIIEAVDRGEADVAIQNEASANEEQCIAAIILFPARDTADQRAKGEYLRDMEAHFEDYEDAILAALLSA